MNFIVLLSILAAGFAVAFLHAALPTHWLPFVLAARGQGWSNAKALAVTGLAGFGHVLFTIVLGILVVWLGMETSRWTANLFPYLAGGVLILFGLYYLSLQARNKPGHHHWVKTEKHHHDDHDETVSAYVPAMKAVTARSDIAVILGLLAILTFSPCEAFLPVYLSGIQYGWAGFLLLSVTLATATIFGMVVFTGLALAGMQRLRLATLEHYESGIIGSLLLVLGLAVMVIEL